QIVTLAAGVAQTVGIDKTNNQARILNTGGGLVHVHCFNGTSQPGTVATTGDFPVPGGLSSVITKSHGHDQMTLLSSAGTTVHVCTGEGF
ncbi:MAG: hypothetical protein ACRYF5_19010, partial [Janthinobacterium lividum]